MTFIFTLSKAPGPKKAGKTPYGFFGKQKLLPIKLGRSEENEKKRMKKTPIKKNR
jgi:hypothetical protein